MAIISANLNGRALYSVLGALRPFGTAVGAGARRKIDNTERTIIDLFIVFAMRPTHNTVSATNR